MRTARTLGIRLSGERPTDAIAVNQLITKMNPKTPKNILNACGSIGPYDMRTANARTLKRRMNDTDMPVNIRPEDEPLYRDAASLITKTMNTYAQRYKGPKNDKEIL